MSSLYNGKPRRETWSGDEEHLTRLVAVDPGDVHVGVAFFETWGDPDADEGWECVDTQEMSPEEFEEALPETLVDNEIDIFVFEKFLLYADKAGAQTGSEFRTSQMIGVLNFLLRIHNRHAHEHERAIADGKLMTCEQPGGMCNDPRRIPRPVEVARQLAAIQNPTRGILKSRGIKSTAKKNGDKLGHQVSAELHGWYYLLEGRHSSSIAKPKKRR